MQAQQEAARLGLGLAPRTSIGDVRDVALGHLELVNPRECMGEPHKTVVAVGGVEFPLAVDDRLTADSRFQKPFMAQAQQRGTAGSVPLGRMCMAGSALTELGLLGCYLRGGIAEGLASGTGDGEGLLVELPLWCALQEKMGWL